MMERLLELADDELGEAIRLAGEAVAWPPTPDIAASVARATAGRRAVARRLGVPSRRRTILLIAAVLVLLVAVAAVAATFIAELGAVDVRVVPGSPTATATLDPADLGVPVSLRLAGRLAGFEPVVPVGLGRPDRVWVDGAFGHIEPEPTGRWIALAWRSRSGLPRLAGSRWGAVLFEFEGDAAVASKMVYAETGRLRVVSIGGRDAYWVTGPHELRLLTANGPITYLVRARVLLWRSGSGLVLRLESRLLLPDARSIAQHNA